MLRWLTLLCSLLTFSLAAQDYRYVDDIATGTTVTSNVVYGTVPSLGFPYQNEASTTPQDLVMDLYFPQGDTRTDRPMIVFVHSGGFLLGDRTNDDMVAFCEAFAKKGYVTATIDYRKGFYPVSNAAMHSTRAAYRGLQDGRSAVRFLRANAATYGIDPSRVYMAGSSAGSFVALHSIYMNMLSERPADAGMVSYSNLVFPFFKTAPDLGGYDVGAHLTENGTPDAIVALWGAVVDTSIVTSFDQTSNFLVHGSADGTVPFDQGAPFGVGVFPDVQGSNLIKNRLDNLGIPPADTYFVTGADHEFYGTSNGDWVTGNSGNSEWPIVLDKATDFLWQQHKPTAEFSFLENDLTVNFTDASTDALSWMWDFGDGNTAFSQSPTHVYAMGGSYPVGLYVENSLGSWDTVSYTVQPTQPVPVSWLTPLTANYTNGQTHLKWSVAQETNNEKFVVEHRLEGAKFEPLGEVKGAGTALVEKTYHFLHDDPQKGTHYYRIRQVDFDQTFSFSNTASIQIVDTIATVAIYPNPSSGNLIIEADYPQTLSVLTLTGQTLLVIELNRDQQMVDLSQIPNGIYFVHFSEQTEAYKLVVQWK